MTGDGSTPLRQRRSIQVLARFVPGVLATLLALLAFREPDSTWVFEYYPSTDLTGSPITGQLRAAGIDTTRRALASGLPEREGFSVRLRTCFEPPLGGRYKFRLSADEGVRLLVDGAVLIDHWEARQPFSDDEPIELSPAPHVLTLEYRNHAGPAFLRAEMTRPARLHSRAISQTRLPGPGGKCSAG